MDEGARPAYPALFLERDLSLRTGRQPLTAVPPGYARVKVAWAGVCGSDLHVLRTGAWVPDDGWPAVLGHEVCGVVDAVGDPDADVTDLARQTELSSSFTPDDRVVVDSRVPCGRCSTLPRNYTRRERSRPTQLPTCAEQPGSCEQLAWLGEAMPGGFAGYVTVPTRMLHRVPDDVPLDLAVLTEPLAVALHAIHETQTFGRSRNRGFGHTLILGGGPIGVLIALLLQIGDMPDWYAVASVSVVEPDPDRRALLGALTRAATYATISDDAGPDDSGSDAYDTVFDAAGYPDSLTDALAVTRANGRVTMVAIPHAEVTVDPTTIVEGGKRITGVNGFDDELQAAFEILQRHGHRFAGLITDAVLLDEAPDALANWLETPPAGKAVIRP